MNKRNYGQFFAIIKKNDWDKDWVVESFTNGKKKSLRALTDKEFTALMAQLQPYNTVPPGDLQRKKMISLARKMQWGEDAKELIKRIDAWCQKQKFKKTLMQHSLSELGLVLAIFEQRVYADYLTGLNN